MTCRGRLLLRSVLLPALVLPVTLAPSSGAPSAGELIRPAVGAQAQPDALAADGVSRVRPGVRLRKLHLVRPDLIPYPIAHEVYC